MIVRRDSPRIILDRLTKLFLGVGVPSHAAIALTEQIFQLRQPHRLRWAMQVFPDLRAQAFQVPLGCGVSSQLQGELSAALLKLHIAGAVPECLLVDQKGTFGAVAIHVPRVRDSGVRLPRGAIFAAESQVPAQRLLCRFQVVVSLGTSCTVEQKRSAPPKLEAVHKMHAPAEHSHDGDQNREKNDVEPSCRFDHDNLSGWERMDADAAVEASRPGDRAIFGRHLQRWPFHQFEFDAVTPRHEYPKDPHAQAPKS